LYPLEPDAIFSSVPPQRSMIRLLQGPSEVGGTKAQRSPQFRINQLSDSVEDDMMSRPVRTLATTVIFLSYLAAGRAHAGGVLDQSNVVNTFIFDAAVASEVSRGQTFTVGLAGLLSQVNLEIYQSPNTIGSPTFEILGTTGGVPDNTKVLYTTTIPLSDIPIFANPPPGAFPLTSVDVSSAGIMVTPGEVLALTLSRDVVGVPPWLLWRQGIGGYTGGNSYDSIPPGSPWTIDGSYEGGFQTFVSAVPEPSAIVLALIGVGCLVRPLRKMTKKE
jgi:hypothetical protein